MYVHETYRALKAGRELRGWSQAEMAEKMAEATGDDGWNEARVTAIENKRRKVTDIELKAYTEVQGFDVSFYWYGPPINRQTVEASSRYLSPVGVNTLDLRDISKSDDEAARDTFRPRRRFFGGAMDLLPKPVDSFESPRLIDLDDDEEIDRWMHLFVEPERLAG